MTSLPPFPPRQQSSCHFLRVVEGEQTPPVKCSKVEWTFGRSWLCLQHAQELDNAGRPKDQSEALDEILEPLGFPSRWAIAMSGQSSNPYDSILKMYIGIDQHADSRWAGYYAEDVYTLRELLSPDVNHPWEKNGGVTVRWRVWRARVPGYFELSWRPDHGWWPRAERYGAWQVDEATAFIGMITGITPTFGQRGRPKGSGARWRSSEHFRRGMIKTIRELAAKLRRRPTQMEVAGILARNPRSPKCDDRQIRQWCKDFGLSYDALVDEALSQPI